VEGLTYFVQTLTYFMQKLTKVDLFCVLGFGFRDHVRGPRMDQPRVEQLLHRNVQRFRGGLVSKAHILYVPLNSRLESNKEEEEDQPRLEHHHLPRISIHI